MHFSGNIKITKISDDIWEMARIRLFCEFYFENQILLKKIFENSIIRKLPLGHARPHKQFRPDRLSRFDVYWIQANRHPNRQTSKVYIFE